jgi:PAS domain S-box-containing protein
MKPGFIDKLIERIDRIDPGSLQTQFLRLAQEKGLLETIFQAIQEGVLVLDGGGLLTYANEAAQKLLGFSLETAQGQPLRDLDWDKLVNLDPAEWTQLMRREIEIRYPEVKLVEFYLVPLKVVNPKENGAVMILRDITRDRRQAETTIESERLNAIMLLAAGVAHEIGNPLNSLTIHLQLMEREVRDLPESKSGELRDLLNVARDEVARLDQIINQFLGAIRPSEPLLETVPAAQLLEDSVRMLRKEAEDRSVWIEIDCPDNFPPLHVDKGQMRQALFNLVKNAMQAMTAGGLIKVTAMERENHLTIAVRDTGSGIEPDVLGGIFEPFTTTKKTGTGLGLMIVQRILRDHGGHIEIDTRPGLGTTVTLVLPRDSRRVRMLEAPRHPETPA